ncbi:MAG: hypothetical protein K2W96_09755 [Gemmataceae bacterium]|nr:hypothetical protein [Gemmataceae bacterium]
MPLFIDRLPFNRWVDATRQPLVENWTIVLPVMLTDSTVVVPPVAGVQEWALDTGSRGEAFAWRHHLLQAGLDPLAYRLPRPMRIRTVSGQVIVPVREADLWLVSNIPALMSTPYRIPLASGVPFQDAPTLPDPHYNRPLIGMRALRTAGVRVELDFGADTVSVWTPDVP